MRRIKRFGVIPVVMSLVLAIIWNGPASHAGMDTPEELCQLYARSAVLMDADSGRILFEKNGYEKRAMASTTKILTCIIALERGKPGMIVTASERAARQPKVHLGVHPGETFYLGDLLYSLMLESHNDAAVMAAEGVAGSVEAFAELMNEKAVQIGCRNSHFVTPNGLDDEDAGGKHATTAAELAQIMRYCIMESPKREEFLEITRTASKTFQDADGKRTFSCYNHNAFLQMMDGAMSGKTGFTADAGYCYVGALKRDKRTFIVALLACGWPGNRGYKWKDTKALMQYGISNYRYREIRAEEMIGKAGEILVPNGRKCGQRLFERVQLRAVPEEDTFMRILLKDDEQVEITVKTDEVREAPVRKGEVVGVITYRLHGADFRQIRMAAAEKILPKTFGWTFMELVKWYFIQ